MPLIQSDRIFSLWDYTPSHTQLLIRSPMTHGETTNFDIRFDAVQFVYVPAFFKGITIDLADANAAEPILAPLPPQLRDFRVFLIRSGDMTWYVIAGAVYHQENTLGPFTPWFDLPPDRTH
jgi:hypothetical protein